ncbi:uncharacterized protein LOC111798231 [Cucurbita pepo subsp. pepo]|uniref:uncharacterized protein LOC111798231 n=1 Tax=Cucurbita pepo subsp. pepo TaxID=3664 RepID=UPI000C9D31CA|nr:uncharacterized protein LOC111798231 [Cucurbita pepo subsp. pepo]XP_023537025.1 uncharacterized protein LOC111798231 [Cucurbita pepo subsp. pepo]
MDMGGKDMIQAYKAMELQELSLMMVGTREDGVSEASISTENSINSFESFSSELLEDASSTSTSSLSLSSLSSSQSSGPLYELSELMANLPIKRGLSKFYNGKSQSFTSLASAKSLEDLAKKVKKMKCCKSYGGSLDAQRSYSPKPLIAKKASKRRSRLFVSH